MNDSPASLPLSVVVPARNAAAMIAECLASVSESRPAEVIVVDGMSTDDTIEIARRHGATVLSDEGRGVAAARMRGAEAASQHWVALVDTDVILPPGSLRRLFDEFLEGGYTALQAGLESTSGSGYWGRALAEHHRTGRSKHWFGVVATIFERDKLLRFRLDSGFTSGEDIELRMRLQRAGERIGVSRRTTVIHRFGDSFEFALGQWLADGAGLGRTIHKHGLRSGWLLALPLAAAGRGIVLSLLRLRPQWIPYYVCYLAFNYVAMLRGAAESVRTSRRGRPARLRSRP